MEVNPKLAYLGKLRGHKGVWLAEGGIVGCGIDHITVQVNECRVGSPPNSGNIYCGPSNKNYEHAIKTLELHVFICNCLWHTHQIHVIKIIFKKRLMLMFFRMGTMGAYEETAMTMRSL